MYVFNLYRFSAYRGDSCYASDRPGTCSALSKCPSLVREMRRAGNPLPNYMRKKLRNLGCGFENDEPLVSKGYINIHNHYWCI